MEKLAWNKHSSLLHTFVKYRRKKFYKIGPSSTKPLYGREYSLITYRREMVCSLLSVTPTLVLHVRARIEPTLVETLAGLHSPRALNVQILTKIRCRIIYDRKKVLQCRPQDEIGSEKWNEMRKNIQAKKILRCLYYKTFTLVNCFIILALGS
jgi:hypothetical protein